MKLAVLMFHALYRDDAQRQALRADERPYAISDQAFEQMLDSLAALNPIWIKDPQQLVDSASGDLAIMLTFDDGHASAVDNALPILQRRAIPAMFFITTDFVDQRDDYCSRAQLMQLSSAGMSVQSHGQTHQFLNTLGAEQVRTEMSQSKDCLEAITGQEVNSISFPGGRFGHREVELGRIAGFRDFHTSRFGRNSVADLRQRQYRRIAYRAGMPISLMTELVAGDRWPTTKHRAIHGLKRGVRMVLGERGYQKAYELLKAR